MLAFSLTESDDRDKDDEEEVEVRERQPTPDCPNQLPFPATEKNVLKLKVWLIKEFVNSSFNILSAPLAKILGTTNEDSYLSRHCQNYRIDTPGKTSERIPTSNQQVLPGEGGVPDGQEGLRNPGRQTQ